MQRRCAKWGGPYAKPVKVKGPYKKYVVNCGQSYGEWSEPQDVCMFHWYDFAAPHPEVSTAYTSYMMSLIEEIDRCKGFLVAPVMNARAAAVGDMVSYLKKSGKEVHSFLSLGEAYDYGQKLIKDKDYLFCVGSLYMVGEIKAHLEVKYD